LIVGLIYASQNLRMLDHMKLNPDQIAAYKRDGFLVLEDFVDQSACDGLRARAEDLVRDFDPAGVVSIFSTHEQTRTSRRDVSFYGATAHVWTVVRAGRCWR
jgi:phytanoyl-CoA dioxygenase PhyH